MNKPLCLLVHLVWLMRNQTWNNPCKEAKLATWVYPVQKHVTNWKSVAKTDKKRSIYELALVKHNKCSVESPTVKQPTQVDVIMSAYGNQRDQCFSCRQKPPSILGRNPLMHICFVCSQFLPHFFSLSYSRLTGWYSSYMLLRRIQGLFQVWFLISHTRYTNRQTGLFIKW